MSPGSSLNVGGAKVETRLSGPGTPGLPLPVLLLLHGGRHTQKIRRVSGWLRTSYTTAGYGRQPGEGLNEVGLTQQQLAGAGTVEPGQQVEIPTQIVLPPDTPLTMGRSPKVRLTAELVCDDVGGGRSDIPIEVLPNLPQRATFDATNRLGLRMFQAEHKYEPRLGGYPFVQSFEFRPFAGPFVGRFNEIQLIFRALADGYDVIVEVDRKRGLVAMFEEAFSELDRRQIFHVGPAEIGAGVVVDLLARTLNRML